MQTVIIVTSLTVFLLSLALFSTLVSFYNAELLALLQCFITRKMLSVSPEYLTISVTKHICQSASLSSSEYCGVWQHFFAICISRYAYDYNLNSMIS